MLRKSLEIGILFVFWITVVISAHAEKYEFVYKAPNSQLKIDRPIATGYYAGTVQFGKSKHQVAIVSWNNNRIYNEYFKPLSQPNGRLYGNGDQIMVDTNDNETFDPDELQPYSKYIHVDNEWYSLDISEDGSKVEVQTPKLELGNVKLPSGLICDSLYLFSENGTIGFVKPKREFSIPAGVYQIYSYSVRIKDSTQEWYFAATGTISGKKFEATKYSTINLDLSPSPIIVNVGLEQIGQNPSSPKTNDTVNLSLNLTGNNGEIFAEISSGTGNKVPRQMPKPPLFKAIDENGRLVAKGTFEYG